jgi:hypothetical protein
MVGIQVSDPSRFGAGFRVQPPDDWSVLRTSDANVLVSGSREATRAFVVAAIRHLNGPVYQPSSGDALPIAPAGGTMILQDVDALDRVQQQRLLRWLDEPRSGRMQVISVSATRLYDLVKAGTFLDALYYRLNVTQFDVISE